MRLGRQAHPKIEDWSDAIQSIENYLDYLAERDRIQDGLRFLSECERDFLEGIATSKRKKRLNVVTLVATTVSTALLAFVAKVCAGMLS